MAVGGLEISYFNDQKFETQICILSQWQMAIYGRQVRYQV